MLTVRHRRTVFSIELAAGRVRPTGGQGTTRSTCALLRIGEHTVCPPVCGRPPEGSRICQTSIACCRLPADVNLAMSTVQEIKAAISALPDADFREVSRAIDEMEAERFDQALETAAQSGKLDRWLNKVDADIDAGRVKPLDEIINDT